MDPGHRHELKTNELADWITHLPDFLRRNWAQLVGAALIIIGVLGVPKFRSVQKNASQTRQADTTQLMQRVAQEKITAVRNQGSGIWEAQSQLLMVAGSLEAAANKAKNPYSAALALIKCAEAFRADLHYQTGRVERSTVEAQISHASKTYELAIEKAQGNNTLTGMAKIGLGLCAEEIGDFDRAKEIYEDIATSDDFTGTIFPAQAELRLEIMDDSRAKFVFVSVPEPESPTVDVEIPGGFGDETIDKLIGPMMPQSGGDETVETETPPQESGTGEATSETVPSAAADQTSKSESETD